MSDPSQPEGPPDAPAEGATKTFVLKIDTWLADLMKSDLGLDAAPSAPLEELAAAPSPEPAPSPAPPAGPPLAGPPKR